ncbi:MAG: DUF3883 domain-containing protein [Chloroflexota bacterium]|nr:DUF3883 domain-containing protein [Chloroflexota bacterium]
MRSDPEGRAPWEGATLSGAVRLLELLGTERRSDAATVRRRFEETNQDYGAHLRLLEALGITEHKVGGPTTVASRVAEAERSNEGRRPSEGDLARRLLSSRDAIGRRARAVIATALKRDTGERDERARIYPTERNLLIDAGVLRVDHDNALYEATEAWHAECVNAAFCRGKSPAALEGELQRQADIGLRAEQAVLEYERGQVRHEDRGRVIHVAAESTSAGFDIASVRWKEERRELETRLIEVKAVGAADWRFVWTSHERVVAQAWGKQYFVYLVPIRKGQPDTEEMRVIQDPATEIHADNGWAVAEGDWTVQRDIVE